MEDKTLFIIFVIKYVLLIITAMKTIYTRSGSKNSVSLNDDTNDISHRGTNGEIYDYAINIPVYYNTFWNQYGYNAGDVVTFTTTQSGSLKYVIELWHNTNSSGDFAYESNFQKGVYVVQFSVGDKTMSQKVNI